MKPQVAPYETAVKCLRIECTNGLIVRLTRYPVDLTMSNGQVYQSGTGYDFTGYTSTSTMSPSAIDLEGFLGFAGVTRDTIASGIFDGARCYLFATSFLAPIEDYEPIVASVLGKTTFEDEKYRIEEMGLTDALNQSVGTTYTAPCSNSLGDSKCGITLALIEEIGTLSHISSATVIRDSARTEAADWFGAGYIRFTTGNNAGLKPLEIKAYAADGTIETFEPFHYLPAPGDAYVIVPGCRKRLFQDCRDKWQNVAVVSGVHPLKAIPNKGGFFGFSNIPTSSQYAQIGTR